MSPCTDTCLRSLQEMQRIPSQTRLFLSRIYQYKPDRTGSNFPLSVFWLGFAGGMIIYLGAMSSIDTEILEYCELENMSSMRLLWSIVVPLIFPTILTYIVVGMASFFTNAGSFHAFFGTSSKGSQPSYETLGYVFFVTIARDTATEADYSYAAAGGLMFTAVIAPITVYLKYLLEKYGPRTE